MASKTAFYLALICCLLPRTIAAREYSCPIGCHCTSIFGFSKSMSCDGVGIIEVMGSIPPDIAFLEVRNANITKLSPGTFGNHSSFYRLKYLSFSENLISMIEATTFSVLPGLETLNLSTNHLGPSSISQDTFLGLEKLQTLDLSYNELENEAISSVVHLTSLSNLILSFNSIRDLSCAAIGNVNISSLERLEVVGNYLTHLDSCVLLGSESLHFLNASSNKLKSIQEDTFKSVPMLRTLSLRNNKLAANDFEPIAVLQNLQVLSLTRNYITSVPPVIKDMTSLKTLYLSDNPIQTLRTADLTGLSQLENFYFRRLPDLELVEPGSLDKLPSLRVLAIEQNPLLKSVPLDSVPDNNLQSLTHLMLSANGVTSFSAKSFLGAPTLLRALISGNPLHCNCQVTWIKAVMERPHQYPWAQEWLGPAGPDCNTPVSMKNMIIADIDEWDLTCEEPVAVPLTPLDIQGPVHSTLRLQAILSVGIPTATWFDPSGIPLTAADGGSYLGTSSVSEVRLANNSVVTTAILFDVATASSGQYTLVVKNADKGTALTFYVKVTEQEEAPLLGVSLLAAGANKDTQEGVISSDLLTSNIPNSYSYTLVKASSNAESLSVLSITSYSAASTNQDTDGNPTARPDYSFNPDIATIVVLSILAIGVSSTLLIVLYRVFKCRKENEYSRLVEVELGPTKRIYTYGSV